MAEKKALTVAQVKTKGSGLHQDVGTVGLYLRVTSAGTRSWVFRYRKDGKLRDMGLGDADLTNVGAVTLADARRKALEARALLLDRKDPLKERDARRAAKVEERAVKKARAEGVTFEQYAKAYIREHSKGWRNAKHKAQWPSTLQAYAFPILGHLTPAEITTDDVLKVLEQPVPLLRSRKATGATGRLWDARAETATRVRARVETILSAATADQLREGLNPAAWGDNLEHKLQANPKSKRVVHRPAIPFRELPEFMAKLRQSTSISARALELCILCANRPGEVLGATFDEFDLDDGVWVIGAKRMKASKEHRIPLVPRAIEIVEEMAKIRLCDFVFPGVKSKRPLSDMSLTELLRGMREGVTVHGTARSAFRDWATVHTLFQDHIVELALAHISTDAARKAYARDHAVGPRVPLMLAWGAWLDGPDTWKAIRQTAVGKFCIDPRSRDDWLAPLDKAA